MQTANTAERQAPSSTSLAPRPDQPERWLAHDKPIPFDDAAQLVLDAHHHDGERDDLSVHQLRTWAFGSGDGHTMQLTRVPFEGRPDGAPLNLRELAFSQLCTKLGAPAHYIRSLPPKLQIANINWGLVQEKSPALLRLAGNEVRAILSDRYAAADDELLLNMVGETLDRSGYRRNALVRATGVGPHTLLRITLPSDGVPVKVGDVFESGIDVANSELGLRSVQVTPVTFRLVCTNGLRAWKSEAAMRMRHVGDPKRLWEQLQDAIPIAFAEARGDIDRWKRAVEMFAESAAEQIESLRQFGLGNGDLEAVARTFAQEHNLLPEKSSAESLRDALDIETNVFEVANAITATARDCESVPARLGLEEVAHRYLVHHA